METSDGRNTVASAAGRGEEDDGLPPSFLPAFANEENKALDRYVRQKERELHQCEAALEEHKDRIKVMQEHQRNVQEELVYTQQRVESKKKEAETEKHLKQLNKRETGRLMADIATLEKEAQELQDKLNALQNTIFRGNEKLDHFRQLMNWNQEELDQWAIASKQKEEDNAVLAKYAKKDNAKIRELSLKAEKMAKEVHIKKVELDNEVTETQAAQIQLDKTAEDFKALHGERQELVRQWEEATETMTRRDEAIQAASAVFAENRARGREKRQALDKRAKLLESEKGKNKELDARVSLTERTTAKLKITLDEDVRKGLQVEEQADLARAALARAVEELSKQRNANIFTQEELGSKRTRLETVGRKLSGVKRKVEEEFGHLDTLEKRMAELAALASAEEARLKAVKKEVEDLKDKQLKASKELHGLRIEEKEVGGEIAGAAVQSRNMAAKIRTLEQELAKQQETLYTADFNIQAMERKVARASGERSDSEKRELTRKIEELQAVLDEKNSEHTMLLAQVKRAEEDLTAARRRHAEASKEATVLQTKIAELVLESDTAAREVKKVCREKEEKMVAHDILRLQLKRLQDILSLRADEVLSLENRRVQLQLSMEERRHEVEVQRDLLRAELKAVTEDMHKTVLEKKERGLKVAKLCARYEVLIGRVKKEEGEERSQAYYVIKAAQEREALQREGDQLDAQIRQGEKEVRALEATLEKLAEKNGQFRSSFRSAESEQMAVEKEKARAQLDRAYDKLKVKRSEEALVATEIEQQEDRRANLGMEQARAAASLEELRRRSAVAAKELAEQVERSKRAQKRGDKLRREHREKAGFQGGQGLTQVEQEIKLTEVRESNREVLQELKQLCAENPTAVAFVEAALGEARLKLPSGSTPAGSRGSSRQGSIAGSLASVNTSRSSLASRNSNTSIGSARSSVSKSASVKNVRLDLPIR